jgi:hypothetical protein
MIRFSNPSVAENTPPSVTLSSVTNNGPISPRQSNDDELVSFARNADEEAWIDNLFDLEEHDSRGIGVQITREIACAVSGTTHTRQDTAPRRRPGPWTTAP